MTVRLRGAVSLLEDKRQAIQKSQTFRGVRMVISHITVKTETIPDAVLLNRLRERVTQGQNDTIKLQVKKGGVTIPGRCTGRYAPRVHFVHRRRYFRRRLDGGPAASGWE